MKKIALTMFMAVMCSFYVTAQSSITGIWNTEDDNTDIEIYQDNDVLMGKVHSSDNEKVKLGSLILKDIKESDEVYKGKIYATKRKEWYDVEITPKGDKLDLKIDAGLVSKSLTWNKVNK